MSGAVPPTCLCGLKRDKFLCNLALDTGVYTSLLNLTVFPKETANWLVTAVTWHRRFQECQLAHTLRTVECCLSVRLSTAVTQFITLPSTRPALIPVIAVPSVQ